MANDAHLAILKQGTQAWNQWRVDHPKTTLDLSEAALSGADLSGADLSETDLSGSDLSDANLFGANLRKADLFLVNLTRANLSQANLQQADLSEADLNEANLYEANLQDASLSQANLYGTNLNGATLDKSAPAAGEEALRLSLLFAPGMALAEFSVAAIVFVLARLLPHTSVLIDALLPLLLILLVLLIQLLGYGLMGIVVPARTGQVRAGIFTSLWSNAWLTTLGVVVGTIGASIATAHEVPSAFTHTLIKNLLGVLILAGLFTGLGAGISALVGLAGKALHKPRKII